MILVHFTPAQKAWTETSSILSTGNIESITRDGLRPFASVVYDPNSPNAPDPVALYSYSHHARRGNRKGLWGRRVIVPGAVVFKAEPVHQQGYDGEEHLQVNELLEPETIVGWFTFTSLADFTTRLEEVQ